MLYHGEGLWGGIRSRELDLLPLAGVAVFVLASLALQGLITSLIASYCGKRLGLIESMGINITGSMWNLLVPIGSMGYKMVHLHRRGIHWQKFTSFSGIAMLASLSSTAMLLSAALFASGLAVAAAALVLGLAAAIGTLLGAHAAGIKWRAPAAMSRFVEPLNSPGLAALFFKMLGIHCLGLLVYVAIYSLSFRALGFPVNPVIPLYLVCERSVLIFVAIVPGNLMVQEGVDGWLCGLLQGVPIWWGGVASALIRVMNLALVFSIGLPGLLRAGPAKELESLIGKDSGPGAGAKP